MRPLILPKPVLNPFSELLVRDGNDWTPIDRRLIAGWQGKGAGVYLPYPPISWMRTVPIGAVVMEASNEHGKFVFDGFGWQRSRKVSP